MPHPTKANTNKPIMSLLYIENLMIFSIIAIAFFDEYSFYLLDWEISNSLKPPTNYERTNYESAVQDPRLRDAVGQANTKIQIPNTKGEEPRSKYQGLRTKIEA